MNRTIKAQNCKSAFILLMIYIIMNIEFFNYIWLFYMRDMFRGIYGQRLLNEDSFALNLTGIYCKLRTIIELLLCDYCSFLVYETTTKNTLEDLYMIWSMNLIWTTAKKHMNKYIKIMKFNFGELIILFVFNKEKQILLLIFSKLVFD